MHYTLDKVDLAKHTFFVVNLFTSNFFSKKKSEFFNMRLYTIYINTNKSVCLEFSAKINLNYLTAKIITKRLTVRINQAIMIKVA